MSSRFLAVRLPMGLISALVLLTALLAHIPVAIALQLEDQGAEVEALQQKLQEAGFYEGPITGYFGSLTQEAVMQFQQANGLTADGVVGSQTQAILESQAAESEYLAASESYDPGGLVEGSQGPEVSELQTLLNQAGYYNGAITGSFGPETTAAVQQFQTNQGLAVDGVAGPRTLAALRRPNEISLPSAAISVPNPMPTVSDGVLRRGDEGQRVVTLQEKLGRLGFYRGVPNGRYDVLTEAAVLEFQQVNQLQADGTATPQTLDAIENQIRPGIAAPAAVTGTLPPLATDRNGLALSAYSGGPRQMPPNFLSAAEVGILRPGVWGNQVMDLQSRLREVGFYTGPVDGLYGAETEAAVRDFQRSQGLQVSGIADEPTLNALVDDNIPRMPTDQYSVFDLQQRLQEMNVYRDTLDGLSGPNTTDAIRAAQERYGIDPADIAR